MSGFNDFWGDDPDYDGAGKSRMEEADGSMKVVGCLLLVAVPLLLALMIALSIWIIF